MNIQHYSLPDIEAVADNIPPTSVKSFLLILIPAAIALAVVLGLHEYSQLKSEIQMLVEKQAAYLDVARKHLAKELETVNSDLMYLSESQALTQLLKMDTPDTRERLARVFVNLAKHKKMYDQVRYLDDVGMEIVRVNFNEGDIRIVPQQRLQNKASRYYFRDAFKLERAEVFISPLDLNVENGQVERPFEPMLRVATPVYGQSG